MAIELKIKKNIPLAPMTTFKIGGPAKFFVEVASKEDLVEAVEWAKKEKEPIYYLGGGSNLLIADEGLPGLVIKFANREAVNLSPRFNCGAGASLAYVISLTRAAGLSGLEWGFGIPQATIGGCVRGNAGGFGMNTGDIVETVEAYNLKKNRWETLSQKDCQFGYRSSIFKTDPDLIIWSATFRLKPAAAEQINAMIDDNMKKRDTTQPKLPNAGSVFKNLFVDNIRHINPQLAEFIDEQEVAKGGKIGAGYLIDMHGLKGKAVGGAKISLEHANFIVNTGRATARDVIELIEFVKKEIKIRFKVELEEEIVYLR
ncbi:MAG TPA: UDP-N-acetylmuramate dehydrogenase [Candidatus Nanoarchaeia archaeon]|nr:UDP-N-acetylmuramate dehydrogenase [Candidatus Nanoarchaeia archaeon]